MNFFQSAESATIVQRKTHFNYPWIKESAKNVESASMNRYRFILDPSSKKYKCPNCGKFSLVIFIDTETGELMENYGRCDRESKCGFFYPFLGFFLFLICFIYIILYIFL